MSKKRAKSGGSAGVSRWETGLLTTQFEEEEWKCTIAFVVGSQLTDYDHIAALTSTVDAGSRKLFSVISKNYLIDEVRELGSSKGKKTKDSPLYSEICEVAKAHLDQGEEIPLQLLSKVLKWKLLAIKQTDQKRREDEKKGNDNKDKKGGGGKEKGSRSKSPAKGKGKKSPEVPSPKKESKLKKRGEDNDDNKYIDDEPDDGPQHYVIIEGFTHVALLPLLSDLQINVDSVIKVSSENYESYEKLKKQLEDEEEDDPKPPEILEAEQNERDKISAEIRKFWNQHETMLRKSPKESKLHDVARLTYLVKEKIVPIDLNDNEQKMEFGTVLFENIACLMYDLLDLKRQYLNYRDNMKLLNIPCTNAPAAPLDMQSSVSLPPTSIQQMPGDPAAEQKEGKVEVDMRYYNEMMNCLPFESVSVPLMLHCMLEQVVASEEGNVPPSEMSLEPREDDLNHKLAKHVNQMALKLTISNENRQQIEEELHVEKKVADIEVKQPYLTHFHDKMAYRLHHLKEINGFNPIEVETNMLNSSPCARLCKFPRPAARIVKERAARLQELMYFCSSGELTAVEIDRTFKQFVFESLCLRETDDDGKVREAEKEDIVWDDPYPVYDLPQEVEEQVAAEEPCSRSGTSILRSEHSKSRIGSAGSVKSVKSTVHFEKDADGQPIIPEKDLQKQSDVAPSAAVSSSYMQDGVDTMPSGGIGVKDLAEQQLRNLDEWSYAEYLEPHILLQVLEEANHALPYIDTYFHKRDHSLMVVMHNPIGPELTSYDTWNTQLHSDVGFRNYLEHISSSIEDWTQAEEGKYQAILHAKEMEALRKAAESPAVSSSRAASSKSRTRSQSPKKSRSKSPRGRKSVSPTQSVDHLDPDGGQFMRPNSMKAWKIENDKLKEEERKQKEKSAKKSRSRSRSASPKKMDEKEKTKDKKREGSARGSAKGKKDEKVAEEVSTEITGEEVTEETIERKLPFIGYDVGNNLLHVSGQTKTLFPSDGGQIRTETTKFVQGSSFVKTTVFKDGHVFGIHLLEPKEMKAEDGAVSKGNEDNFDEKADSEQPEKSDAEKEISEVMETESEPKISEPMSQFGAFTAHLNDGMILSYSCYGNSGKPKGSEDVVEAEIFVPPPPSPSPPPQSPSPKGRAGSGKKGKKQQQQQQLEQEKLAQQQLLEQQQREEEERRSKIMEEEVNTPEPTVPEFQQLYVSCPDGLSVNYSLESDLTTENQMPMLMVRQAYHAKTAQKQECESVRKIPAMMEESRIVTSEGAVIKFMLDGTTQVLFPDGTVSGGTGPGPTAPNKPPTSPTMGDVSPSRLGSAINSELQHKKSSLKAKGAPQVTEEIQVEEPEKQNEWITTSPSGDRVGTKGNGDEFELPPLMVYSATDPMTKEVMTTREDRVVTVDRPDGTKIVDHNEGTRITTFYTKMEATDETSPVHAETGETQPIEIREVRHVKVECVGFATVIMNCEDSIATTVFPNGTQVITMPDGSYEVLHHEGSRMTIDPEGMCAYLPKPDNLNVVENLTTPSVYMMCHSDEKILQLRDGRGNFFTVMNTGEVDAFVRPTSPRSSEDAEGEKDEKIDAEPEDKVGPLNEHPPRFFIIKNDGSGMELLRHRSVMDYLSNVECDPTSAILGDPLPDHPGVTGITIMRPYTENICNTWLMQFDEPNIIPHNLRSRDFKTLPAREGKTHGPTFGTNVGKGVAVGSAKGQSKSIPPPKCPKAIELRQLIQYKAITNELRAQMQDGLRSYAEHIKAKREAWASQEIYDPRDAIEKVQAGDLLTQILSEVDEGGESKDQQPSEKAGDTTQADSMTGTDAACTAPKPASMVHLPADRGFGSGLRDMKSDSDIVGVYERVTAPPVLQPKTRSTARYSNEDWQKVRSDLEEENNCRNALKNRVVPPYFSCSWGQSFLASNQPDMAALSKDLAKPRKLSKPTDSLPNTPTDSPGQTQGNTDVCDGAQAVPSLKLGTTSQTDSSPSPITQAINVTVSSPSDVRPTNPTPGHATGQGTPTPLRPTNPTPAHASQTQGPARPGNPTPAGNQDVTSDTPSSHTSIPLHAYTIPEHNEEGLDVDTTAPAVTQVTNNAEEYEVADDFPSAREDLVLTRSLVVDVNGEPRKERVALPSSILGQKPGALPNQKFQEIEDPVRAKTFNSSIAGAKVKGVADLNTIRGFELYPGQVNFGVVREGCTYTFNVLLKNIGVDSCRFRIKQPPPSTGLSVIYKSGPVAAGMNVTLRLELYAIAVGVKGGSGQGSIGHHVEISSEVDTLFLPVTADVLTAHVYDEQCRIRGNISVRSGVVMVSTRPPSREGIIRPRKDRSQECSTEIDSHVVQ